MTQKTFSRGRFCSRTARFFTQDCISTKNSFGWYLTTSKLSRTHPYTFSVKSMKKHKKSTKRKLDVFLMPPLSAAGLKQRPHSLPTNCPCTDWVNLTHTLATNTIERSTQTYAHLATALRPLRNTAKDFRPTNPLPQHPTISSSFPHNQPTPPSRPPFSPVLP